MLLFKHRWFNSLFNFGFCHLIIVYPGYLDSAVQGILANFQQFTKILFGYIMSLLHALFVTLLHLSAEEGIIELKRMTCIKQFIRI